MNYLGLDVHKRTISYCVRSSDGTILQEGSVTALREELDELLAEVPAPCVVGLESTLFTGDTLFASSVGGAYGDVSTYEDILNSVRSKIFTLPDETVLMPGHGPPTTVALEKAHNPFFPAGA